MSIVVDAYLEGKAAGMAEGLLALLGLLGLEVSPDERQRIRAADLATIDRWFERAATAPSTAAVLCGRPGHGGHGGRTGGRQRRRH